MSIWKFDEIKREFNDEYDGADLLTLDEGDTPVEEINFDSKNIFIKREDKNPTGSWKDRGTALKLSFLKAQGVKEVVMTSSGNAAISFIKYTELVDDFKIHIVLSPNVDEDKLQVLRNLILGTSHELVFSKYPRSECAKISAELGIPNLKFSADNEIVKGYWSLGFEISNFIKEKLLDSRVCTIFCPVSSGSGFVGMYEGLLKRFSLKSMPRLVVCQTEEVCPLVTLSGERGRTSLSGGDVETPPNPLPSTGSGQALKEGTFKEGSLADAIVQKKSLRKPQILKILNDVNGTALAISNNELLEAEKFMKGKGVQGLSYTSLLSVAGFLRITEDVKYAFCIASGR